MRKKSLVVASLVVVMSLSSVFSSFAGEWRQDNVGWWWDESDVWYPGYPTSRWMAINGKDYYFGADGYMLHDTIQDGFQLDSSGARVVVDLGLEVAPYKTKLDILIANNIDYYNGISKYGTTFGFTTDGKGEWIDAGNYYIIKNITLGYWYDDEIDGGMSYVDLDSFNEIYVRKDGKYIYAGEVLTLDKWKESKFLPRTDIIFDEKGYIIGWNDGGAS